MRFLGIATALLACAVGGVLARSDEALPDDAPARTSAVVSPQHKLSYYMEMGLPFCVTNCMVVESTRPIYTEEKTVRWYCNETLHALKEKRVGGIFLDYGIGRCIREHCWARYTRFVADWYNFTCDWIYVQEGAPLPPSNGH